MSQRENILESAFILGWLDKLIENKERKWLPVAKIEKRHSWNCDFGWSNVMTSIAGIAMNIFYFIYFFPPSANPALFYFFPSLSRLLRVEFVLIDDSQLCL